MAEALGLVASIIAVVQLAESITRTCAFLIESIEGCPRDLRLILLEASAIKALFQNLEFMKKHDPEAAVFLNGIEGSVTGCLESITELENLIPHTIPLAAARKRKRPKTYLTLASLAWPLKRAKAKSLLHIISQHKATISAMISAEALQDVKDIKRDLRSVSAKLTDAERYNIYKWLQCTDPSPNHNTACSLYENGTGDWVLRIAEWHDWTSTRCRCLWIHGIPGAGKTVLASHLIEQTSHLDTCSQGEEMPVASVYYYCYHARNQDEAAPFLRWIITKLCQKVESVPSKVLQIFKLGNEPKLKDLLTSFEEILVSFKAVFITIDAIDESQHRENLLDLLRDLINDPRFGKVQLLITSREYIDIKEAISTISQPVSMSNPCVEADIKTYVAAKIQSTTRFRSWSRDLCEEVQNALSEGARGMFRWAVCQLDILRRLHDTGRIRLALKDLPIGLDETYTRIFSYVPEEDCSLLRHVLWMICCHSSIYVSDVYLYTNTLLATFPTLGPGDTALRKSLLSPDLLKEICGCLVTFESCEENHKEVAVLAHYTVREFLESDRSNRGPTAYFHLDVDQVKKRFLTIALQHIMNVESYDMIEIPHYFWRIEDRAGYSQINVDRYYLVSATCAIGLWESIITNDKTLMTAVIQFLDPSTPTSRRSYGALRHFFKYTCVQDVSSDMNYRNHFWEIDWIRSPNNTHLTTLTHMLFSEYMEIAEKFASTFEYTHIACLELSIRWTCYDSLTDSHVDARFDGTIVDIFAQLPRFDFESKKPLELICQLLANSLDPTSVLISYIGSHQHDACLDKCMVDWLLERGADPHGSGHRVTPLQIAVSNGDFHGVKSLLQAGANPNAFGNINGLKWGSETTFGILFNDLYGKSPLSIADNIEASNNEIVDLLIQSKGTYNCAN